MKAHGYHGTLSTATLAASGTLGILIPPSVPLVVYAILTEQNIAKLFAAAMIPGVLAMLSYLLVIFLVTHKNPQLATQQQKASWYQRVQGLTGIGPILLIFLIVFGGIYGGVFSPTEGAAIGALLTLAAGLLKRELDLEKMKLALSGAAETSGMVFMIFLGADMMNTTLALTQMPAQVASWMTTLEIPGLAIVLAILLFYVLLGCVMDELSMLLLTIPVIFPAVMGLDLFGLAPDLKAIWFGILVLVTVGIGLIAPPIGLNVYVVNNLARDIPIADTYRGVLPFLAADFVRMILLLFFPVVSLFLVMRMG
jgi:tripartite ATP-independent transporter DctM subunit